MIEHFKLKQLLSYNPKTGGFIWLESRGGLAQKGAKAGTVESKGYRQITIDGKTYMAHRLAWFYINKNWPADQIDHINGSRLDNRIINLRSVTKTENQQNQKKYTTNKSGVTGVCWHKQQGKWYANIQENKKVHFLGLFENIFDAAAARISAQNSFGFHSNHGRR